MSCHSPLIFPLQQSLPGTPAIRSQPSSRPSSRPGSPTRGARGRALPGPLRLAARSPDPLKAFPSELSQRIFSMLSMRDLASCSRVSRKWQRSQTLNYGTCNARPVLSRWHTHVHHPLLPRSLVQAIPQGPLPRGRLACGKVDPPRVKAKLGASDARGALTHHRLVRSLH